MGVVLDTSVVVAFMQRHDIFHASADTIFREHLGKDELCVSVITYAEILTGVGMGKHAKEYVDGFFSDLISEIVVVNAEVARVGAKLRTSHPFLRLPDALIVATAQVIEADLLVTADAAWKKIKGLDLQLIQLR